MTLNRVLVFAALLAAATCLEELPLPGCQTSCGRDVPHGWSGPSDDRCNTCTCSNGALACTDMPCTGEPWECLKEGDVCKLGGLDRSDECPAGTVCLAGEFDGHGQMEYTCEVGCETSCGRTVPHGWVGLSDNRCNTCYCNFNALACTPTMCIGEPLECLKEGDVCKLGGVDTGKGLDRSDECPDGTVCTEGKFDERGRVNFTCEQPRICCFAIATCQPGYKAVKPTDCTEEEFLGGECKVESICCSQQVCRREKEEKLQEGEVCEDIGVDRMEDCAEGLQCLPDNASLLVDGPGGLPGQAHPRFTCQKPRACCLALPPAPAGFVAVKKSECTKEDFSSQECLRRVGCCSVQYFKRDGPGAAGTLCARDSQCGKGLLCCYPCGIQGCENQCMKPCDPETVRFCFGGCPLFA